MNILVLSCGTRCKLVSYFKNNSQIENVVCTDVSEEAPALLAADVAYLVPKMTDPEYLSRVFEICEQERIKAVIPLHEDELMLIAKNRDSFIERGILPIISGLPAISLCRDKLLLSEKLIENGIPAVETVTAAEYLESSAKYDSIFVKPREGAGSVHAFKIHSKKMLEALIEEYDEEFIIQPAISGKEYGVDVYADMLSGKVTSIFCKQKLRMRAGETEKSISVRIPDLERLAKESVELLGLIGPIDIDVLEQNGKYFILEINPRFGGGYPHAYECGMDFTELIANNSEGIENKPRKRVYEEGILGLKYSDIVTKRADDRRSQA